MTDEERVDRLSLGRSVIQNVMEMINNTATPEETKEILSALLAAKEGVCRLMDQLYSGRVLH